MPKALDWYFFTISWKMQCEEQKNYIFPVQNSHTEKKKLLKHHLIWPFFAPSFLTYSVLEKISSIQNRNFHKFSFYSIGVTCSIISQNEQEEEVDGGADRKNFEDYLQLFKFGFTMISFDLCTVLLTTQTTLWLCDEFRTKLSIEIREK